MPSILLKTQIDAPIERVFDLSRSIDLHQLSTSHTREKAIAGRMSGLIKLDDTVTWEARHLGIVQQLTSKITEFNRPHYFVDEMLKGAFQSMRHFHLFSVEANFTIMRDEFIFESPYGYLGHFVNYIFLKKYMIQLLNKRNQCIKSIAESDRYHHFIS